MFYYRKILFKNETGNIKLFFLMFEFSYMAKALKGGKGIKETC